MTCPRTDDIDALVMGELGHVDQVGLEEHLRGCRRCENEFRWQSTERVLMAARSQGEGGWRTRSTWMLSESLVRGLAVAFAAGLMAFTLGYRVPLVEPSAAQGADTRPSIGGIGLAICEGPHILACAEPPTLTCL